MPDTELAQAFDQVFTDEPGWHDDSSWHGTGRQATPGFRQVSNHTLENYFGGKAADSPFKLMRNYQKLTWKSTGSGRAADKAASLAHHRESTGERGKIHSGDFERLG